MNILILEPDLLLAKTYSKAFEYTGLAVQITNSAQQAISVVDQLKPDLIILELQLAGHSGIEFLHELRSYEDWSTIKVMINSCVPESALGLSNRIWKQLGVDKYLYKATSSIQQLVLMSTELIGYEITK
jgi:hypothetical protein